MSPTSNLPIVAIVGRPNVGKSTLFNRFAGTRRALVEDVPGITRDRIATEIEVGARRVLIVDTAGLDGEAEEAAIKNACANLQGLLTASQIQARRLGSVYIGRQSAPIAVAIVDREGEPITNRVFKHAAGWIEGHDAAA